MGFLYHAMGEGGFVMFEENAICKMLGLKYPIFQGGMAWLGTAELASAVSEAGGLGIIGAGHMPPDVLRAEIQKVKKATKKPFGVNIMLMSPFVKEVMQLMLDERVPVVTTGAGVACSTGTVVGAVVGRAFTAG